MTEPQEFTDKELEDAKNRACEYSAPMMSPEQLDQSITDAEKALKFSSDFDFWVERLNSLRELKNDPDFKKAKYPQSIDKMLHEVIEIRSLLYAMTKTSLVGKALNNYYIFNQLQVSMIYNMISKFGKLTNNDTRDSSIVNYWSEFSKYLIEIHTQEDLNGFTSQFSKKFTNKHSETKYFRNKVIAHNEESISLSLESFDEDLKLLIIAWSELTCWSSFGYFNPWFSDEYVFETFKPFCNTNELNEMKNCRKEYINKAIEWSKTSINGKKTKRSAFGSKFSISATIHTS